jgi:hypothetical protein
MKPRSRTLLLTTTLSAAAVAAFLLIVGGSNEHSVEASAARPAESAALPSSPKAEPVAAPDAAIALEDEAIAPFQARLLDLAYETASALPVQPHVKTRSRVQGEVVDACLKLDQPRRALGWLDRIQNWQRGLAYAELAFYCVQHGAKDEVEPWLEVARKATEVSEEEIGQAWRRDRIRAAMARTYLMLGRNAEAAKYSNSLADSESGSFQVLQAKLGEDEVLEEQLNALDGAIIAGDFEQVQGAMKVCAELFDRFYADEGRRSRIEEKMKASWGRLPVQFRIEITMDLADSAVAHGDSPKALALGEEARALIEGSRWRAEHRLPMLARLAGIRGRAGEAEKARAEADAVLAAYDADRDTIGSIYRAGALRPLAAAYNELGDAKTALAVYKRAVEEGVVNPNSRPRAEDLSATCCSMALEKVEPDAELAARMKQIFDGLKDPW